MKANRNQIRKNENAEVGIGTLIVFIAMVLVAAVAAAVLVNTSGLLQSRALSTGKATSDEVASSLKILEVYSNRSATTDTTLENVTLYLQLSAGGLAVDVDKIVVFYLDENGAAELKKGVGPGATTFSRSFVREVGTTNSVLEAGEVVKLHWAATISANELVKLQVQPSTGQASVIEFHAPGSFGNIKDFKVV